MDRILCRIPDRISLQRVSLFQSPRTVSVTRDHVQYKVLIKTVKND